MASTIHKSAKVARQGELKGVKCTTSFCVDMDPTPQVHNARVSHNLFHRETRNKKILATGQIEPVRVSMLFRNPHQSILQLHKLNTRDDTQVKALPRRTRAQHNTAPHLFHLAVRLHEVGDLHDLELVQPDGLPLVERLELLECSERGGHKRTGCHW